MAGTGCTISFLKKRFISGDLNATVVSMALSAVSWNIGKADTKIRNIVFINIGARSTVSGDWSLLQNTRSGTTTEAGTIWGSSFQGTGDQLVLTIFGT